jgi:EAL domain-containing protein (putative c-di-GMP-specific phosphodiesterase class I)
VQTLGETGLPPEALELELTETSVMAPGGPAPAVLARLKALGLGLALDDFGTGFASLAYLTRFPFDALKIDSAFMTALEDEKNRAIVGSVIELARRLGMRTVAEGVETETQLGHLRDLGCDQVQGFAISPPVPALEVPALLARLTPQPRPAVVGPATDRRARPRRVAQ